VADTGVSFFRAQLVIGNGVDLSNNEMIVRHDSESGLQAIVVENGPAPGLPNGYTIPVVPERFVINPQGRLAMIADARDPEGLLETWLWVGDTDGSLEPILKVGDSIFGKAITEMALLDGFDPDEANRSGRSGGDGMAGPFNKRGQLVLGILHGEESVIYLLDFSSEAIEFRLSSTTSVNNSIQLSFPAEKGQQYQLESSLTWETAGDIFIGDGTVVTLTQAVQGAGIFYRMVRFD
jgi:hypothetical protein